MTSPQRHREHRAFYEVDYLIFIFQLCVPGVFRVQIARDADVSCDLDSENWPLWGRGGKAATPWDRGYLSANSVVKERLVMFHDAKANFAPHTPRSQSPI